MAELSITIQGVPQLIARLGRAVAEDTLAKAMTKATARVQSVLQEYPSPPSGSTYVRTGDLGRSWSSKTSTSGDGVTGTIGNAVRSRRTGRSYARYVQADETEPSPHQVATHQGRWVTDVMALDKNRSAIEQDFGQAISDALR